MTKIIPHSDLICMDELQDHWKFRVETAYSEDHNLLFGERIYHIRAKLFLHKDLAQIVCLAAKTCIENDHYRFILYDGLRTTTAQEKMLHTKRVQNNPQWLEEPRLLSPPGAGGHPRGMAIDIALETIEGVLLDMGTAFDFLAPNSHPDHNPAHRHYKGHSEQIMLNREILNTHMINAAQHFHLPLVLLPEEWWDFRFPADIYNQYTPISDNDLPPDMRLVDV